MNWKILCFIILLSIGGVSFAIVLSHNFFVGMVCGFFIVTSGFSLWYHAEMEVRK